jgi:hypothetical protein
VTAIATGFLSASLSVTVSPPCGDVGQPCCTGGCNTGLGCSSSGVCLPCGGPGQVCCAGGTCSDAAHVCDLTSIVCEPCGLPGELCCAGGSCQSGSACQSGVCATTTGPCGQWGTTCDPQNDTCCSGTSCMMTGDPNFPSLDRPACCRGVIGQARQCQ